MFHFWAVQSRISQEVYNRAGCFTLLLKKVKAVEVKTIDMSQGQKISRILAWTFAPKENRKDCFK